MPTWRRDGSGRASYRPLPSFSREGIYTPDDIMAGAVPKGPVLIYDDDHFYMGGVIAEKLRQMGLAVTLVTPAESASFFTHNMLDHGRIQARLIELDVNIVANRKVTAFHGDHVETACVYTGRLSKIECGSVVTVTARNARDELAVALRADEAALAKAGIKSVRADRRCLRAGDDRACGVCRASLRAGTGCGASGGDAVQAGDGDGGVGTSKTLSPRPRSGRGMQHSRPANVAG